MTSASTKPLETRLYVRRSPVYANSVEILHLTLDADPKSDTVWAVHFYGDTKTAPPDLFGKNSRLDELTDADQMWQGDSDIPKDDLDRFHRDATATDGRRDAFYGGGWTLMPSVPER